MSAAPITRRALLGATAAAGAMGIPIAAEAEIPAAHPDAELSALLDRCRSARAAWDATEAPTDEAVHRAEAGYPPMPDALRFKASDLGCDLGASGRERTAEGRWRGFYTNDDVARLRNARPLTRWAPVGDDPASATREPDPEGEARRREIVAAHDAWDAACGRVRDAVGLTAATEAEDAAADAWAAADGAVRGYRPRTLAGLALKAAWVADRLSMGRDDGLGAAFAREVAAFGGIVA